MKVPTYKELLDRADAPPGSSWGIFGEHDRLGTINFLGTQAILDAVAEVKCGLVVNLDYPLDTFVAAAGFKGFRKPIEHHMFSNNANHRDDWVDSLFLQQTSQIDGLRHMRHPRYGFYGGVPDSAVQVGTSELGIQQLAEHGVVGRGVLLDAALYFENRGDPLGVPGGQRGITPSDLDAIAASTGTELRAGDVLLLRTGWAECWLAADVAMRDEATNGVGLLQSREMLAWLWDHRIAMVAADNVAVEALPVDRSSGWWDDGEPSASGGDTHNGMLHRPLIALFGMPLGELWKLDELSKSCAADGSYSFLLVAKPLNLVGGVGSPANAVAIK